MSLRGFSLAVCLAAVLGAACPVDADGPRVATLSATVAKPGTMACAMWTLKTFDQPVPIPEHAFLVFDLLIPSTSVGLNGGVEIDGGSMAPSGIRDDKRIVDQAGETLRGGSKEAGQASHWYTRRFDLSALAGKTFTRFKYFSSEIRSNLSIAYEANLRNVRIEDASAKTVASFAPAPAAKFDAVVVNMAIGVSSGGSLSETRPMASAVLDPRARMIMTRPWGAGATPLARSLPDDQREITISAPIDVPGVRVFIGVPYLRLDRLQIIPPDATLVYDMRIDPDSVSAAGGFDLESVPRSWLTLRDTPRMVDQFGASAHPANQVRAAVGKWLTRRFSLASIAGRPFGLALLSAEFTPSRTGIYRASYRNIRIVDESGNVYWNFFPKLGELGASMPVKANAGSLTAPGVAGVSLTPERYVVPAGTSSKLDVAIHNYDPADVQNVVVNSVRLEGVGAPVVLAKGLSALVKPGETSTIAVSIRGDIPPGNYKAVADYSAGGVAATTRSFAIGVTGGHAELPGPSEYLAKGHFAWGADIDHASPPESFAELRENGGNFVNLFVSWNHIEVTPGQCNFSALDASLAAVAKAHLRAEVFFWTTEEEFPEWLQQEAMQDEHGNAGRRVSLSYYAPIGRPAYMNLIRAIVRHYRDNETVVGYQFPALGWGDGFYATPTHGGKFGLYDYSPWSQNAFRGYVRDVLRLTLAQASRRYGISLGSWDDLKEPAFGHGFDLRPIWWDFQNFRCWTVENMLDEICRTVRSVDTRRGIELMYGGDPTAIGLIGNDYDAGARIACKYGVSIHNTCYEGYAAAPFLGTYTREWRLTHTCETAGTPCDIPNHQQGMFNVLKYGAMGYCWVGGRPFGYYPSFAALRPVAREVSDAHQIGKRVGVLMSLSAYQCDPKNERLHTVIASTFQFVHNASLPADLFSDRSFLADGHKFDPAEMPVVIDCGAPVLAVQVVDVLAGYVRGGGAIVLSASSGKYTAGDPDERFRLLTRLGYAHAANLPAGQGRAIASGEHGRFAGMTLELGMVSPLVSLPDGARILARFADGRIAAAAWNCGSGEVVLLAGTADYSDAPTRAFVAAILAGHDIVPVSTATNGVVAATLESKSTRYILLHNPSPASVKTIVATTGLKGSGRAYDLVARHPLAAGMDADWARGVDVSLAPYEVTAVAIDEPNATAAPRAFAPVLRNNTIRGQPIDCGSSRSSVPAMRYGYISISALGF